jgi:hypothetical protein
MRTFPGCSLLRYRLLRLVTLIFVAALLGACSALQFSYNNADGLVRYLAWDYLDLDAQQSEELQRRFLTLQDWHRASELPEYVKFMRAVDSRIAKGIAASDIEWAVESLRARYAVVVRRAVRDAAPVLATLSPRQVQALERKFSRENEKFAEQWLSGDEKKRQARRVDRVSERVEDWMGKLNAAQRKRVESFVLAHPQVYASRLEDRRRWQREVIAALKAKRGADELATVLGRLLAEPERTRTDEFNRETRQWENALVEMLLDIHESSNDSQRDRLKRRIARYAEDFHELSMVNTPTVR